MADPRRRAAQWLLVDGDRHLVAALVLVGIFLTLAGLGEAGLLELDDHEAVRSVSGGLIPGLFAFLSIVLAINQLVLSQEFGSAGEIRDRIESVQEYRHDIEELADERPSPVLPTGFLTFVVVTIESEARTLAASAEAVSETDVRDDVTTFARSVTDEAARASDSLERVRPGRINALLPVLEYDDSYQIYEARRLRETHSDSLPDATRAELASLIETLELFNVARMQFRTTYTQRVLARLSRQLLYVGVPTLVVVIVLGLMGPTTAPLVPDRFRVPLVSALFSVALAPLAVLSSFLVRMAAVSERTVSVGPFVSRPKAARVERDDRSREPGSSDDR